jgi:hypothetical protein
MEPSDSEGDADVRAARSPFAKKHGCRISVICHCLPRPAMGDAKFFQCCGWYHTSCEGRDAPRKERAK